MPHYCLSRRHRWSRTKSTDAISPSKPRHSKTTTGNILEKACVHLIKTDPSLKPLIDKHHCAMFSADGLAKEIDPFRTLTSCIISQQLGNNSLLFGFESSRRNIAMRGLGF